MCVFLRKKGERTPPELRPYLKSDTSSCLKKGMVEIFTLGDPDGTIAVIIFECLLRMQTLSALDLMFHLLTTVSSVVYDSEDEEVGCSEACINAGHCQCSKCRYLKQTLNSFQHETVPILQLLLQMHGEVHSLPLGHPVEW